MVDNSKYHLDRIEAMETEITRLSSVIDEKNKEINKLNKKISSWYSKKNEIRMATLKLICITYFNENYNFLVVGSIKKLYFTMYFNTSLIFWNSWFQSFR